MQHEIPDKSLDKKQHEYISIILFLRSNKANSNELKIFPIPGVHYAVLDLIDARLRRTAWAM